MENLAIELHDTHLLGVKNSTGAVCIELSLYLQSSPGVPGTDAGTGWAQAGELVIDGGVVELEAPPGDLRILDGSIQIDGALFDNLIPLPFKRSGRVRVHLHGAGWNLVVNGSAAELVLKGERVFIENYP